MHAMMHARLLGSGGFAIETGADRRRREDRVRAQLKRAAIRKDPALHVAYCEKERARHPQPKKRVTRWTPEEEVE